MFDEGLSLIVVLLLFLSDKWLQLSKVMSAFIDFKMPLSIFITSKYLTKLHSTDHVPEKLLCYCIFFYCSPELYSREYGLRYVGGSPLTLWALLAGTVERLEVEPLAVFAPGAR